MSVPETTDPRVTFGRELKELLGSARITPGQLVEKTGISRATIGRYLRGNTLPSVDRLELIVRTCGGEVEPWMERLEAVSRLDSATKAYTPAYEMVRAVSTVFAAHQGVLPCGTIEVKVRQPATAAFILASEPEVGLSPKEVFGKDLSGLLEEAERTPKGVARKTGLTYRQLRAYLLGRELPPEITLERIVRECGAEAGEWKARRQEALDQQDAADARRSLSKLALEVGTALAKRSEALPRGIILLEIEKNALGLRIELS